MKIEIDIPKKIMNDMVMEQEIRFSSCFVKKDELIDDISQEFLSAIISEYKMKSVFNQSLNNISIKISKKNGK